MIRTSKNVTKFSIALGLWFCYRFCFAMIPLANSYEASATLIVLFWPILTRPHFFSLLSINALTYIDTYISLFFGLEQLEPLMNYINPNKDLGFYHFAGATMIQFTWMLIAYPLLMIWAYKRSGVFKRLGY